MASLACSGKSKTAEAALEQALIARFGSLGRVASPFCYVNNGLVFTSRKNTALVKSYGLQQEFITPYTPEQNGMVERVIRTLNGAVCPSAEVRDLAACQSGDWRLDPVLQPEASLTRR